MMMMMMMMMMCCSLRLFLPEVILFVNVRVRAITVTLYIYIQNNKHSSHNTICLLSNQIHNIRLSTGFCIDARNYSHGRRTLSTIYIYIYNMGALTLQFTTITRRAACS